MNGSPKSPTPEDERLDPRIVDAISSGLVAAAPTQREEARIRGRLMRSIAGDCAPRHHTTFASREAWQPFLPGIACKLLHEDSGVMSYLLRFEAGAILPAHRHPIAEECLVLSGALQLGSDLHLQAGDFHLAAEGCPHAEIRSANGATIFLRGAVPHPEQAL